MGGIEALAETSAQVAATGARLKKIGYLSDYLRTVTKTELPIAVKFLSGELMQGKIGVGGAAVRKALIAVGEGSAAENENECLKLAEVAAICGQIAAVKGKGANQRRHELLCGMLEKTSNLGRTFLGRLILGELRHGALEGILVEAIAKAMALPAADVRRAVMLTGDLCLVATTAAESGPDALHCFALELFRPVQPMLAEPADDVSSALQRLGLAALEYKLDGVRVQVHKRGDEVRVFTRHLQEVTQRVPELVERTRCLPLDEAILDGEVLAFRADGRPHPFPITMRRLGRKLDVDELRDSLPLSVLFFDCLLVNRQPLIDQTTQERHRALADCLPAELVIPRLVTSDVAKASDFFDSAVGAGHEGVMAKSLEANYEAGGRGQNWLKIKRTHTLDLVILAAEWGSGRRHGWLSNLHLGARDPDSGGYVMIGKTFKGLTDQMLTWQTEALLQLQTLSDDYTVHVRPQLVVEIAFNEVQHSPHYASGFALRFARVKRYRLDKTADEADTIAMVAGIYAAQIA